MEAKRIVCLGDSNTHGYCGDPADFSGEKRITGEMRFGDDERWPRLLGKILGEGYNVIEEGLNGRTTVFEDPFRTGLTAAGYVTPCLMSHRPVSLLIVMLGTNDLKAWYGATAERITAGMEYVVRRALEANCWTEKGPNVLVVAPPPVRAGYENSESYFEMGRDAREKSLLLSKLYAPSAARLGCAFFDSAPYAEINAVDYIHMTRAGCRAFAEALAPEVKKLVYSP